MDKEQAYKIGLAFKLGMIYAKGKAHARKLTTDKAEWITVHPNGKENKGRPALIDSATGQVLGGMGGKFNGKHISKAHTKSTPKEIKKLNGISKEKLIELRDKLNKTDANELFKTKENQSKNNPKEIDDLLKGFNQEELKNLRDKLNNTDFNNLFKKDTQKNDSNSKEINDLFKGISQEKLKALKDKLDQTDEKNLIKQTVNNQPAENNTVKEAKSDKETPKAQQINKISLTMQDAIDPAKFKEYNKNVKKEFNKLVKKNQTDKEDYKNFVENMDLDPKFKEIIFEKIEEKPKDLIKSNGEHFNPHNNFWVKSPKDIDLNQEVQSYMYFLPSSQTSKMIEDMTEAEKNELKEVIFNENNEKKLKWLQIEPNQNNKIYHTAKIDLQNKYRNELSGANSSNAQNVNNQPAGK